MLKKLSVREGATTPQNTCDFFDHSNYLFVSLLNQSWYMYFMFQYWNLQPATYDFNDQGSIGPVFCWVFFLQFYWYIPLSRFIFVSYVSCTEAELLYVKLFAYYKPLSNSVYINVWVRRSWLLERFKFHNVQ